MDKQGGSDRDDATNLVKKIDGGFVSEETSAKNEQEGAGFGYGVITGFAVTLGLVALIAVAYFAYTRASPRNAAKNVHEVEATVTQAGVRAIEDEENCTETQNSAGRLSRARRIATEEENLAHTMKNLNGNPFADPVEIDSNKVAREVQA